MNDDLDKIVDILREGKIILYPTDTIWGLGCDSTNEDSIKRIYNLKKRDTSKPFILLVSDIEMLKRYVKEIHPRIETLLIHHSRPLTVIYKSYGNLPQILLEAGKVAIRIIKEPVIKELIEKFDRPIVSTSANISEEPFPKNFSEISNDVKSGVDYIFNYRRDDISEYEPSVIATFSRQGKLKFLR